MKDNIIKEKSFEFVVRIMNLCSYLSKKYKSNVIINQIPRSGTSIGANVRESINASSKADFINKLNIALKEANETQYWLELLKATNEINEKEFISIYSDCEELVKLLVSIIKTSKNNK